MTDDHSEGPKNVCFMTLLISLKQNGETCQDDGTCSCPNECCADEECEV